ncbi:MULTISPECIES: LysR family transcriptional regulator [Bradyrhizobium]|jgi:DNA-binding transcriptional LysR family regulator|uniref:LysR family transcriptional regulator n=1 Tax=Bradyrhizobium TaxID=374 RepID=UPI000488D6AE|nr:MULTISPECIES: LysR family transcriptional regulator [Bradyrhizobium]MCS3447890.1 DNA-binding transcriptional LysR family regulator [Bradyrhizobium elkanii]MCS3560971.1 DNA-binding transcriptional LysR family regulator [Bradyrhizobium elkanii]MCW2149186.1 DNA-binding transcriptional LysR family regulator [Bradyrhizobium elkanii]MCW2360846.1 DNA-binding transcriptional LysR family regulator [Bradyrhizobium elkanii]MCW2372915.1 DNA-binding transcriptional LysR family regulator [Bradyrhizobium 
MADFRSIETFLWVVKLGSFRGAAQRLNTTQPAISQRIAQLEREMGVKLLNRDHRAASPTPSGRLMMIYAEKLIGLRSEMMAEVGDRSAMRGALRLGVAETIVHTWLPRLVKSVNEVYPNLSLEIEVDITPNLTARLLAQEIELAFVLGPVSASGAHNHVLCDYPIGFLASPALGLGDGPVARQDLARFPIITFPRKTQPYETVRALFNAPDLPPIRLHASTSLATVIHMANEGLGIAVIPAAIVENELADGRLQLLDTDLKLPPLTFTASWLASPDAVAIERVANLARQIAQASVAVDGARVARH